MLCPSQERFIDHSTRSPLLSLSLSQRISPPDKSRVIVIVNNQFKWIHTRITELQLWRRIQIYRPSAGSTFSRSSSSSPLSLLALQMPISCQRSPKPSRKISSNGLLSSAAGPYTLQGPVPTKQPSARTPVSAAQRIRYA